MIVRMIMMNTSSNHTEGSTREDVGIVGLTRFKPVYIISTPVPVPVLSVPLQVLSIQCQFFQYSSSTVSTNSIPVPPWQVLPSPSDGPTQTFFQIPQRQGKEIQTQRLLSPRRMCTPAKALQNVLYILCTPAVHQINFHIQGYYYDCSNSSDKMSD